MSYSFTITAATKALAAEKAAMEFDQIVSVQPNHAKDREHALANLLSVLELMADDDTQDVRVSCSGSLMWISDADQITGGNINASAWYVPKVGELA